MSYPISTSIHLFFKPDGATLNAQIERHIAAGFRFLDFNFRNGRAARRALQSGARALSRAESEERS